MSPRNPVAAWGHRLRRPGLSLLIGGLLLLLVLGLASVCIGVADFDPVDLVRSGSQGRSMRLFLVSRVPRTLAAVLAVVHDAAHASGPSGSSLRGQFASLGRLALRPAVLALSLAHVTLLMVFVAMYTGIGGHLESQGMRPSTIVLIRLAALPVMFLSLVAGRIAARWSWAQTARLGFGVSALGMLGEALLAQSLVGLVACSIVYVAGVALAAPAMISLYGLVSAPNRGSGMALNGFILFVGTSAGPLLATSSPTFRTLALILAGILAVALVAITGFKALADADR